MKTFDIVFPSIVADIDKLINNISWYRKYISFRNIVIIGNDEVAKRIEGINGVLFVEENSLVAFSEVREKVCSLSKAALPRTGWYYQQFLKMAYARTCKDEFYLLWDSDTIPLHKVDMFSGDSPIFHMKTEYNKAYFDTISNLFGYNKILSESFISEHMLIKTSIMRDMIDELEKKGSRFFDVILENVPIEDLPLSGFSEFETYGTFCYMRWRNLYCNKNWTSLRNGTQFFGSRSLSPSLMKWIGKEYDAVSFEKADTYDRCSRLFFNHICSFFLSFSFVSRMYWHFYSIRRRFIR